MIGVTNQSVLQLYVDAMFSFTLDIVGSIHDIF